MPGLLVGGLTILGLLLGSFANVLIHRVPLGMSIVSPPSACPRCETPIKRRHNVPVLGWLWLRGRCAACAGPISPRYVVVEIATGLMFGLIAGLSGPSETTVVLLVLAYFGLVLAVIDLETRRLPNLLTLAFAISLAAAILGTSVVTGEWDGAIRAVIGAGALGLLYFIAFIAYPKGMGFGDVKLAPSIGAALAFLGWPQFLVGAFAAFVWGAVVGLGAMRRARKKKGVAIPFGPWMVVGAFTGVLIGVPISEWYLDLVLV